jgi:hypothetical protein
MKLQGGCYCRKVRYEADGEPRFKGACHCRECQYMTGGQSNVFIMMPASEFRYVEGKPRAFKREDLAVAGTREFCAECGTHLTARPPHDASVIVIKVGTLDDPSVFGMPQAALYTSEKQSFHVVPEGVRVFEKFPTR